MFEFISSLKYLHGQGICHRDIKPHNILVNATTGTVKLCDFGCSKRLVEGEPNIQYICARYYRAPEIVFSWAYYTCAIDMWSAGCVMAEMFTGDPLFPGKNSVDQLARIVKVLGPPSPADLIAMGQHARKATMSAAKQVSPEESRKALQEYFMGQGMTVTFVDLLLGMLQYDPVKRITANAALQHPFFDAVRQTNRYKGPPIMRDTGARNPKPGFQPS
jgi:glycogen synthase kinase 3 beta